MEDVVFVAIDLENANGITKRDALEYVNSQIGFAILDAKDLPSSTSPIVDIPNLQHRHRDFEISQKGISKTSFRRLTQCIYDTGADNRKN